ncbi:hypothetical protein CK203_057648 [Vitis vinifera]|uniref:Uncharacterized protein n=1 Tax=Vitis vinifera TaxID=29760 RepID=A0A438GVP8_VITVI|nr:hypothetical protein CK203_057648 [Vitis vinifera]
MLLSGTVVYFFCSGTRGVGERDRKATILVSSTATAAAATTTTATGFSHRRSSSRDLDAQFANLSLKHKDNSSGTDAVTGPLRI